MFISFVAPAMLTSNSLELLLSQTKCSVLKKKEKKKMSDAVALLEALLLFLSSLLLCAVLLLALLTLFPYLPCPTD